MDPAPTVRYAVPATAPTYTSPPRKVNDRASFSVYGLVDVLFIVAALGMTLWFAALLLRERFSLEHPLRLLYLVPFWGCLAYLALPRLHQLFTFLYVPDYFIARTRTGDGLLGDPVNLGIDGSAEDIHAAMQRAGWVLADEITLRSALGIIRSSVTGRSYPQAPVSALNLFGRRHAFAYQQEVDGNAAQRHHVRFWPVPEGWALPGGHHVDWIAAGTYDRSVGVSLFTGQVTHKIDADIDLDRDYIIDSVRYADPEVGVRVIEEFSTAYHHRNGGGDSVSTDGDLPVLEMTGAAERDAGEFSIPSAEPASSQDRVLPPLPLILTCMLTGLLFILLLLLTVAALVLGTELTRTLGSEERDLVSVLPFYGAIALAGLICAVFTLTGHRWARIGLLLVATVWAASELVGLSASSAMPTTALLGASLPVLVVLGLSSDSSRHWVMRGKKDARIDRRGVHREDGPAD